MGIMKGRGKWHWDRDRLGMFRGASFTCPGICVDLYVCKCYAGGMGPPPTSIAENCFDLVMCLKHVGHVYVVLGPGLLSMFPAYRRIRGMIAGFSFPSVEKICCLMLCI